MSPPSLQTILDLELAVWRAFANGDSVSDERLLDERFLGVYSTGYASRTEHASQLASGPVVVDYTLHNPRLLIITPDVVVLAYLAKFRPLRAGIPGMQESMYVSSLWHFNFGQWRNVFSQDTSAA